MFWYDSGITYAKLFSNLKEKSTYKNGSKSPVIMKLESIEVPILKNAISLHLGNRYCMKFDEIW